MNEQQKMEVMQNDIMDLKIRMGINESSVKKVEERIAKIEHGINKIFWTLLSTIGLGVVTAVVNYVLTSHK